MWGVCIITVDASPTKQESIYKTNNSKDDPFRSNYLENETA